MGRPNASAAAAAVHRRRRDPDPGTYENEFLNQVGLNIDHGSDATAREIRHEGWLWVDGASSATVSGSQLLDTCAGVYRHGSEAVFSGNTMSGCPDGWALTTYDGATVLVEDNDIRAGGIELASDATGTIIGGTRIRVEDGEIGSAAIDISGGSPVILIALGGVLPIRADVAQRRPAGS